MTLPKTRVALFLIILILACTTLAYALLKTVTSIPSVGIVKTVGVEAYWDLACTNRVTEINWGLVEPNSKTNATIFLKNPGNAPITLLLSTENWNPSNALNYIALTWDYAGQTINPGAVAKVNLTLAVSSNITGITSFSFDIVITGVG